MKRRFRVMAALAAVLLCLAFAGCTQEPAPTAPPTTTAPKTETQPTTQPTEPPVDLAAVSLTSLRQALVGTKQMFAVAYLGFLEDRGADPVAFVQENNPALCDDLPFLTAIAGEDVIGDWGEVYCIVPAEGVSVTLYQILWDEYGWQDGIEEFLVRDTDAPFLLLCNSQVNPEFELAFRADEEHFMGWQPNLNQFGCVTVAYDDVYEPLMLDFSGYAGMLEWEYEDLKANGWTVPTAQELVGTSWRYEAWIDRACLYVDREVLFEDGTAYVRWYVDEEETYQVCEAIPWTLEQAGGAAILTMDFGGFAGVRSYNVLLQREADLFFLMPAVLTGEPVLGGEALRCYMDKSDLGEAPDPMEMVGSWQRLYFEVEGYREESQPGAVLVEIKGTDPDSLTISYREKESPGGDYTDKGLSVEQRVMYQGCGNSRWVAEVMHVGQFDTYYTVTLLTDGRLLLQNYWIMDGAPTVSYEWFARVE